MKKRLFSLLCVLVLLLSAAPFAAALEGESQRAADILAALHVAQGYDGAYRLNETMTRGEMATLLLRFAGLDATSRHETALVAAKEQGWLTHTVPQDGAVSADEFCSALLRLFGRLDNVATNEGGALHARRVGLTAQDYEGELTRGHAFQILRDALTFSYKDGATAIQRLVDKGVCTQAAANALGLFDRELTAREIADRYMSAVFCIRSYDSEKQYRSGRSSGEASGFFITEDGLAVTNYHSIAGALYATATLVTGETYDIRQVLYYDQDIDIALMRVSRTSTEGVEAPAFSALELGSAAELRPGDVVYTLGNPLGLGLAVSSGLISAVNRDVDTYALPCVMNTADISKGSSGGALLNIYGHVTAVTSGAYTYGNNMYLAVPIDPILEVDRTAAGKTLAEILKETSGHSRAGSN